MKHIYLLICIFFTSLSLGACGEDPDRFCGVKISCGCSIGLTVGVIAMVPVAVGTILITGEALHLEPIIVISATAVNAVFSPILGTCIGYTCDKLRRCSR